MNTLSNHPLLAVRAIILNEINQALFLKRSSESTYGDMWCFPGGKIDFGQTAEEAIVREIREETSLNCQSSRFIFYRDGLPQKPDDQHYLTLYFYCQVKGTINLNKESTRYAWLGPKEIEEYTIAFGNDKAFLDYWYSTQKQ